MLVLLTEYIFWTLGWSTMLLSNFFNLFLFVSPLRLLNPLMFKSNLFFFVDCWLLLNESRPVYRLWGFDFSLLFYLSGLNIINSSYEDYDCFYKVWICYCNIFLSIEISSFSFCNKICWSFNDLIWFSNLLFFNFKFSLLFWSFKISLFFYETISSSCKSF